jgi:mono/diheme cytochrome c family protein
MRRTTLSLAALLLAGAAFAPAGSAQTEGSHPPVPFTDEFLADEANVSAGRAIWQEQCQHCHGKKAYPGKAPKLQPRRYKPDFVYRRVTDGFRKMPPWKDVYSDEERMQVTAYVLAPSFSP